MPILSRKTPFILLLGDLVVFAASLWATLLVRYVGLPEKDIFVAHLLPFAVLFLIWVAVYFISGLYESRAVILRNTLSQKLVYAQLVNAALAALFFYLAPFTDLTPKTNLFIYLGISSALILFWRSWLYERVVREKKVLALLVGAGSEMKELCDEVNSNPRYNFRFVRSIDLDSADESKVRGLISEAGDSGASAVVLDYYSPKAQAALPALYELLFKKIRFSDMHRVYESVFGRVPLSLLNHSWFVENVSAYPKYGYDALKRMMDFVIALILGAASLLIYPFVFLAIKLDDGGPVFIIQERVGKDGKIIRIPKFRSMTTSDRGIWVKENDNRITKVGKFLRQARVDELPQLFSVIKGDMSLVGPRPDILDLGMKLSAEIPYYTLRNIIKPGLSGWAQIRQEVPPQSLEETKMRLAYDFYYIKNRSLFLDLKIALQTLATLASRVGK